MATSNYGVWTGIAGTGVVPFRLVTLAANGVVQLCADDGKPVGATCGQADGGGQIPVRPLQSGIVKVAVKAEDSIVSGDQIELADDGCVAKKNSGTAIGVARTGATSGATQLAVIEAVFY